MQKNRRVRTTASGRTFRRRTCGSAPPLRAGTSREATPSSWRHAAPKPASEPSLPCHKLTASETLFKHVLGYATSRIIQKEGRQNFSRSFLLRDSVFTNILLQTSGKLKKTCVSLFNTDLKNRPFLILLFSLGCSVSVSVPKNAPVSKIGVHFTLKRFA